MFISEISYYYSNKIIGTHNYVGFFIIVDMSICHQCRNWYSLHNIVYSAILLVHNTSYIFIGVRIKNSIQLARHKYFTIFYLLFLSLQILVTILQFDNLNTHF